MTSDHDLVGAEQVPHLRLPDITPYKAANFYKSLLDKHAGARGIDIGNMVRDEGLGDESAAMDLQGKGS